MKLRSTPPKLSGPRIVDPNTFVDSVDYRTILLQTEGAMSRAGAEKSEPPSPPLSDAQDLHNVKEYQYNHHPAPNQSVVPYRQDPWQYGNTNYMAPPSNTTWSSPEPNQIPLDHSRQGPYHGGNNARYHQGVEYRQVISNPDYLRTQRTAYHEYPAPQQYEYPNPQYIASDPPTPATSDQSGGRRRTTPRSRPIVPSAPNRAAKAATRATTRQTTSRRAKRGKQRPVDMTNVPNITAPLSEMTKDSEHIPLKDIVAWINRSVEEREADAKKRGKTARPMNSFMLYRSAYAERTKNWCQKNNHQVVSSVLGASWPLETQEIKDQYIEYARIERENHASAHPGYKFTPLKSKKNGRKRKQQPQENSDEEEPSDLSDPVYEPTCRRSGNKRLKVSRHQTGYPVSLGTRDEYTREGQDGLARSRFGATNPGKQLPFPMGASDLHGQYYQTMMRANPQFGPTYVEDLLLQKTEAPSPRYEAASAPPAVGLPGQDHFELLNQHASGDSASLPNESQLDPLLTEYNTGYIGSSMGLGNDPRLHDFSQAEPTVPSLAMYPSHPEADSPGLSGPNSAGEWAMFDNWMDKNTGH